MAERIKRHNPDQSTWDRADLVQRAALLAGALPESKMDKEKFEQLLQVADTDAQIKLRILYNAVVSGITEYGTAGTAANLNNWKSAEKELDKYIEKLWAKHFQGERSFPNIPAVVRYLDEQGWKISQASVYNHQRAGKIKPNVKGEFPLSAVERYIVEANLRRVDGSKSPMGDSADESKKSQYETEILRVKSLQVAHAFEIKKGSYVPRDAFEHALAQRAALFKSDLEAFIRCQAGEMISLVSGSSEKIPDLIDYMLDQFEKCLGRYAEDREWAPPTVAMEAPEEGPEDEEEEE
jgi:hypothetical protein